MQTWQITMQIKKDRVVSRHSNNTSSIIKWMWRYGHRAYWPLFSHLDMCFRYLGECYSEILIIKSNQIGCRAMTNWIIFFFISTETLKMHFIKYYWRTQLPVHYVYIRECPDWPSAVNTLRYFWSKIHAIICSSQQYSYTSIRSY